MERFVGLEFSGFQFCKGPGACVIRQQNQCLELFFQLLSRYFLGSSPVISLSVGHYSQSSIVTVHNEQQVVIEAERGHHGGINVGGNGYSGGGGAGQDGGADGGDGQHGGQGSGAAVSGYQLTSFVLSPGSGGQAFDAGHGGGGGGVLVNGEGPAHGGDQYQGQGYGGGGCTHYNDEGQYITNGLSGVIILEIKPSEQ